MGGWERAWEEAKGQSPEGGPPSPALPGGPPCVHSSRAGHPPTPPGPGQRQHRAGSGSAFLLPNSYLGGSGVLGV